MSFHFVVFLLGIVLFSLSSCWAVSRCVGTCVLYGSSPSACSAAARLTQLMLLQCVFCCSSIFHSKALETVPSIVLFVFVQQLRQLCRKLFASSHVSSRIPSQSLLFVPREVSSARSPSCPSTFFFATSLSPAWLLSPASWLSVACFSRFDGFLPYCPVSLPHHRCLQKTIVPHSSTHRCRHLFPVFLLHCYFPHVTAHVTVAFSAAALTLLLKENLKQQLHCNRLRM